MPTLMIYGANGYTGEMIAREAKKRGIRCKALRVNSSSSSVPLTWLTPRLLI